jgi:hypothetical protein
MIYGSFKVTVYDEGTIERKIHNTTTTYTSSQLAHIFAHLTEIITNIYGASVELETLVMQFHFTIIPKGGCGTVDRNLESVYKKASVLKIVNDDNNCFWYAMACLMNPDKRMIRDHRYPNTRIKVGKEICNKCRCD